MEIIRLNAAATAGNVVTDFTAPSNKAYELLYGQVVLTTNATVANRRVILSVVSGSDTIIDFHAGAVVTASSTSQHHEFMQGIFRETSFVGNALQVPFGQSTIIQEGWKFRITIENGVAGDSYTANIVVRQG